MCSNSICNYHSCEAIEEWTRFAYTTMKIHPAIHKISQRQSNYQIWQHIVWFGVEDTREQTLSLHYRYRYLKCTRILKFCDDFFVSSLCLCPSHMPSCRPCCSQHRLASHGEPPSNLPSAAGLFPPRYAQAPYRHSFRDDTPLSRTWSYLDENSYAAPWPTSLILQVRDRLVVSFIQWLTHFHFAV